MPTVLAQIFEPLVHGSGWSFTVMCGGPVPSKGGALCADQYVIIPLHVLTRF